MMFILLSWVHFYKLTSLLYSVSANYKTGLCCCWFLGIYIVIFFHPVILDSYWDHSLLCTAFPCALTFVSHWESTISRLNECSGLSFHPTFHCSHKNLFEGQIRLSLPFITPIIGLMGSKPLIRYKALQWFDPCLSFQPLLILKRKN